MNVLIVDDELLVRIGLRSAIPWKDHGYTLAGDARSAEEALLLIPILEPVVVITDIIMSGMSGLDLIEAVKKQNRQASFVILTSHRDFSFAKRAIELGAVDYILKHEITAASIVAALDKTKYELGVNKQIEAPTAKKNHNSINQQKRILILNIDRYHKVLEMRKETDPARLRSSLIGLVNQMCSYICQVKLLVIEEQTFIFLLSYSGTIGENSIGWKSLVGRIAKNILAAMNISVHLALSALKDNTTNEELIVLLTRKVELLFSRSDKIYIEEISEEPVQIGLKVHEKNKLSSIFKKRWIDGEFFDAPSDFIKLCREYDLPRSLVIEETQNVLDFIYTRTIENSLQINQKAINEAMTSIKTELKTVTDLSSVESLFHEIIKIFADASDESMESEHHILPESIQRVIHYIHSHYAQAITLDDLASIANKSPNYFSTIFTSTMKISPISYINKVRVDRACEMLSHTTMTLKEIADSAGFPNEKYFFRMFKKLKTLSPGQYRSENCAPNSHKM